MLSLTIDNPSDADQRIDKFLKKYLPNAPLGGIYKWLRTGKVKVNRRKVEQTYRIEEGDVIDIYLYDEEINALRETKGASTLSEQNPRETSLYQGGSKSCIELPLLYEDEHMMIVNKPSGINVHPGDHKTKEVSLIELAQDYLGEKYNTLSFRPSLVHRIDRDTSGCVMIAKDKKTLESLLDLLQSHQIEKVYHTLVVGTPEKPRDTIRAKLLRVEEARGEAKVRVDKEGQEATTHYRVLREIIRDKYSLIECRIETGRTHQIRVHMAHIGHPVLGDKAYGDRGENSFAKREYGITHQLLHARSVTFLHPITKKELHVEAPYDREMEMILL